MEHTTLDLLLAAGCVTVAVGVGALCGLGLLVWLAGGRTADGTEARAKPRKLLRLP